MQESPERKVLIHETLPGRDLKQEDMSGKCLIGSTVQSIKLQDGRCRFMRAQNTVFRMYQLIRSFAIRDITRTVIGEIYRFRIPLLPRAIFPDAGLKNRKEN